MYQIKIKKKADMTLFLVILVNKTIFVLIIVFLQ